MVSVISFEQLKDGVEQHLPGHSTTKINRSVWAC